MSRTDLDPSTLARSLRRIAGDGSIEWVMEPIQASVLLDVADLLDENAKLRDELGGWKKLCVDQEVMHIRHEETLDGENSKLRKLAAEMYPYAKAFLQQYLILGYIDSKSYDWYLQLREMGIEVDE